MSFKAYPKYKESGVEWLGRVPEHWEVGTGRRLFAQKRDPALAEDEQLSATQKYGVLPQKSFMEMEDQKVALALSGTTNFKHVEKNDFVISLRSFQGGIERSLYSGCVSPAYTVLRPTQPMDGGFWGHLLKSSCYVEALQTMTDGIRDGKTISYQQFGRIGLPLPPLAEQAAICTFLAHETAKIDALIAEQQRLIELLQEKRQAVISHAVTKGLNPDAPMKDSGIEWLGEVPEHWGVRRLKTLLAEPLKYGANESADEEDRDHPRFVRITDLTDAGDLREDTFKSLPPDVARLYLLRPGDVLLARSGATVGKSTICAKSWGLACFAGYLIRARLREHDCLPEWFSAFCRTRAYWDYIAGSQIQATIQNVSAEKYGELSVPLPDRIEQSTILREVEAANARTTSLTAVAERAVALLQERRSALISAAVTGQIDVRDFAPDGGSEAA